MAQYSETYVLAGPNCSVEFMISVNSVKTRYCRDHSQNESANERRHYYVTFSHIGQAHTQNDLCCDILWHDLTLPEVRGLSLHYYRLWRYLIRTMPCRTVQENICQLMSLRCHMWFKMSSRCHTWYLMSPRCQNRCKQLRYMSYPKSMHNLHMHRTAIH